MKKLTLFFALAFALLAGPAHAVDGLVTQLGETHVDITARFAGEKILVFGAISRPGDVIVKVTSPEETVDLSHKKQYGPFWLTAGKVRVEKTPGLVYVLSNKPLDTLLPRKERQRYGLDLEDALSGAKVSGSSSDEGWQKAFMRLKQASKYYVVNGAAVKLVSHQLYSTTLELPAKLPLGTYKLQIYRVRDGQVRGHQERTFEVREVKLERWVSNAAYDHPWTFGILFTLMALTIGLVLGIVLRKAGDR